MKNAVIRFGALLLALLLTLSLVACQQAPSEGTSSQSPSADGEPSSEIMSETPSDESSSAPAEETGSSAPTEETNKPEESSVVSSTSLASSLATSVSTPLSSKPVSSKPTSSKPTSTTPTEPSSTKPEPPSGADLFTLVKETLTAPGRVYITTSDAINRDEYVSCTIEVVDPSGKFETILDEDSKIKIRGNSTAGGDKKPYNIKFSGKKEVYGLGKAKKWCLLANMFDKTLIRNKLAYDTAQVIGVPYTSSSTYVDVYLNGKLQGSYQFCEAVDVGSTQVDIDTDNFEYLLEYEPYAGYENPYYLQTSYGIILGFQEPEEPTTEQVQWLKNFMDKAERALRSGDEDAISAYFDIDSMVNDYLLHEVFKCVDALTSSARYHVKDGKIYGGPAWDFDLSSGNANHEYYTTYYTGANISYRGWWCRGIWYYDLLRCDWFEEKVITRFKELQPVIVNLTDDNELGKNRIDYLQEVYGASFKANFSPDGAGWDVKSIDSHFETRTKMTYSEHLEFLRSWIRSRNKWMKQQWNID